MNRGFIIYALGHSNYYRMAETLAASIIFNCPGAKVSILCDDPAKVYHVSIFDQVITLDLSRYQAAGKLVFNKATICMYDHSPYDITIKLDADMIWLNGRDPQLLFDQLEGSEVVHMNRGHGWNAGKSVWTDENEVREAYGFGDDDRLYKIYGEFVYFKKGPVAKGYFKTAKAVFNKPKVKCTEFSNGTFTDELAFQIAAMITGLSFPDDFTPVMNKYLDYKKLETTYAYQLPDTFFAYSIGGNRTPSFMKEQYNILAKHYFHQLGLQYPYQAKDKRSFLPERVKI